jgi:hypothetical protein
VLLARIVGGRGRGRRQVPVGRTDGYQARRGGPGATGRSALVMSRRGGAVAGCAGRAPARTGGGRGADLPGGVVPRPGNEPCRHRRTSQAQDHARLGLMKKVRGRLRAASAWLRRAAGVTLGEWSELRRPLDDQRGRRAGRAGLQLVMAPDFPESRSRSWPILFPQLSCQGLITLIPVSWKSFTLRVASAAPWIRQMAAIWASNPSIGRPTRSR